jgi:hypothetical protein
MAVQFLTSSEIVDYGRQRGLVKKSSPTIEFLVIAGGGGGSLRASGVAAGGGGAGGYRTNVAGELSGGNSAAELPVPLIAGTYPIIVGAGGAKVTSDNSAGGIGNISMFLGVLCIGGGAGRTFASGNMAGGSGGGGWQGGTAGGSPTQFQGFKGGDGSGSTNSGGGGGGAGQAGVNSTNVWIGANGGNGLASSITGSSVTRAGGGGGGSAQFSGTSGGTGGGGGGSVDGGTAGNGTVNTGSGGGGGEQSGGGSGSGGSGVVIFTVPTGTGVSFSGGVTQTNSTVGSKQVYVVTATSTTSETVTFS